MYMEERTRTTPSLAKHSVQGKELQANCRMAPSPFCTRPLHRLLKVETCQEQETGDWALQIVSISMNLVPK